MSWRDGLPPVRGKLLRNETLAPFTWFRVGGPAEILFLPADEADLTGFLAALDPAVPVTALGVGSNVIIRDGGVDGVVIRLTAKPFAEISVDAGAAQVTAGVGALDSAVAKAAAAAGVAGLEFYSGVPGTIGGALSMNAGCYGSETKDVMVSALACDRQGRLRTLTLEEMAFSYRHNGAPADLIWLKATFQGRPEDPGAIKARMAEITARREASQPIREKTGGSTFRNPPGESAWKLVDHAGWRGKTFGGAMFSPVHANFLINTGSAAASDLERLGERVRADVKAKTGVNLEWEIKRIGRVV